MSIEPITTLLQAWVEVRAEATVRDTVLAEAEVREEEWAAADGKTLYPTFK